MGQAVVAKGEDEQLVVEGNQVGPAVGLARRIRDQAALLPEELQPRLQAAHRAGGAFDEKRNVPEWRLGGLGGIAGGEADVGLAQEGIRHLDHQLLKHWLESPSALDYIVAITFNGNSPRLLLLFPGNAPERPPRPGHSGPDRASAPPGAQWRRRSGHSRTRRGSARRCRWPAMHPPPAPCEPSCR